MRGLPPDRLDATFAALADPTRRAILAGLAAGEAFDQSWYPGEAVDTVVLVEQGGRTTLTVRYESRAARDAVLKSRMEQGVAAGFDKLAALLTRWPGEETTMQKITPFLWFNGNAEEAMNFYVSIFRNSRVLSTMPGPDGKLMGATFQLEGQEIKALNGGPQFSFTPAISLFVSCETQAEVDELWSRLTAGGSEEQCGWLKDRYGLSWQIIPNALGRMLGDKNREKAGRAMQAMLQMKKIDIAKMQQAFDQG